MRDTNGLKYLKEKFSTLFNNKEFLKHLKIIVPIQKLVILFQAKYLLALGFCFYDLSSITFFIFYNFLFCI